MVNAICDSFLKRSGPPISQPQCHSPPWGSPRSFRASATALPLRSLASLDQWHCFQRLSPNMVAPRNKGSWTINGEKSSLKIKPIRTKEEEANMRLTRVTPRGKITVGPASRCGNPVMVCSRKGILRSQFPPDGGCTVQCGCTYLIFYSLFFDDICLYFPHQIPFHSWQLRPGPTAKAQGTPRTLHFLQLARRAEAVTGRCLGHPRAQEDGKMRYLMFICLQLVLKYIMYLYNLIWYVHKLILTCIKCNMIM